MTNRIAIFLGFFLVAAIVLDVVYFGDAHMIYLGKKFFALIEWVAFWR